MRMEILMKIRWYLSVVNYIGIELNKMDGDLWMWTVLTGSLPDWYVYWVFRVACAFMNFFETLGGEGGREGRGERCKQLQELLFSYKFQSNRVILTSSGTKMLFRGSKIRASKSTQVYKLRHAKSFTDCNLIHIDLVRMVPFFTGRIEIRIKLRNELFFKSISEFTPRIGFEACLPSAWRV